MATGEYVSVSPVLEFPISASPNAFQLRLRAGPRLWLFIKAFIFHAIALVGATGIEPVTPPV